MVNGASSRVRRREIGEDDLPGVVDALVRGFPSRSRGYWNRGLGRMVDRPALDGCPRYGFLLEAEGRPVGVVLTLFDAPLVDGVPRIRCNLSSWTVDPAHRMQAPLLVASVLKRRDVTYTNISPAPHTWPTIEAQGFVAYAEGQTLVAPALSRGGEAARVVEGASAWRDLPEATLLDDHARYGCTCLVVQAADGPHPFAFLPFRARSGRLALPFMQLVYCRELAAVSRFAGVIGRHLLRRGTVALLVDGDPPPPGLVPLRRFRRGRKYVKGPHPPRLGDLSYTERVIFGP